MRTIAFGAVLLMSVMAAVTLRSAADPPPPWAYGFRTPPSATGAPEANPAPAPVPAVVDDGQPRRLPGSALTFTLTQIRDQFNIADWYPSDHPAMPYIVQYGKRPAVRACGLCHYPNGKGRPENSGVAGLPVAYFIQQLNDFKNDLRKSTDPRKANTAIMIAIAKNMTDAEMRSAAEYFASMPWSPWIRVVESTTVPKTRIAAGMFLGLEGNETEPLDNRIMEMPVSAEQTELRDARSPFIAYVPIGSLKKGEALVQGTSSVTTQCSICHGRTLEGLGPVPGIAGRSPSYVMRQLFDMQQGTRKGVWSELMKPVIVGLTTDDMLAIAAYTASLPVGTARPERATAAR
jgi:cytochrome c553